MTPLTSAQRPAPPFSVQGDVITYESPSSGVKIEFRAWDGMIRLDLKRNKVAFFTVLKKPETPSADSSLLIGKIAALIDQVYKKHSSQAVWEVTHDIYLGSLGGMNGSELLSLENVIQNLEKAVSSKGELDR